MKAPRKTCRRQGDGRRVPGSVFDTLDTLRGVPLCQGFDLSILFQGCQEYQPTLPRRVILFVDTLRDAVGNKALGPPDLDNMGSVT
jgi:hypothetical protein